MQPRFSMIYMVFIGIPAPLPITFAEVVLSSWNDFSFEKIAFRVDESSIFIINHLRPASEGQNHFQCSGTKQLWWKFASRCSETPLFANVHIRLRAFCFTWYHLAPRLFSAFRLDESSISVFFHSCGKLVTQTRFLIIYMVFIGIPAPHRITFQGVVPSSSIELFLQIWAFRLDESSIFNIASWSIRKNVTITFREVAQRNRSENSPLAAARHHFLKLCEFINMHLVIRQITSPAPPSPKTLSQGS